MKKLELRHIVGYLPYELKIKILNHKCDFVGIEYSEVNGYYYIGDKLHLTYKSGSTGKYQKEYKPILRPLSDLTKEIDGTIVYDQLSFRSRLDFQYTCPSILKWLYDDIQILLKYHFDVHGLIEKGLAIDINTI